MLGLRYAGRVDGVRMYIATARGKDFWCRGCHATTLWGRVVVFRTLRDYADRSLHRHELQHVLQCRVLGYSRFRRRYRECHQKYGYWDNPFERDARRAEERSRGNVFDQLRRECRIRQVQVVKTH